MNPQTPPEPGLLGVGPGAIDDLRHYGGLQKYKARVSRAVVFWQESARVQGLPEGWTEVETVIRVSPPAGTWKIYVQKVSGIRMGFAESLNGKALKLLLLIPKEEISDRAAREETRKRV
jgi:hypothetical protein